MAETLSMISIISFTAAGICLVIAIIFFVRFKIPSVVGDLSGRTARRSVEQMRKANEKSGGKSYRPSKINMERGKLTETMHVMHKASANMTEETGERPETGLLDDNRARVRREAETILLYDKVETEILKDKNMTAALEKYPEKTAGGKGEILIETLEEVIFIHTDKVIP